MSEPAFLPASPSTTTAQLIGELTRLVSEAPCAHCAQRSTDPRPPAVAPQIPHPARTTEQLDGARATVPTGRDAASRQQAISALDEVSDDERWLWRLIENADRIAAAAPVAPDPQRLRLVEERYAQVCGLEARISRRLRAAETALARPTSWLRPGHRAEISRQLREDRTAAMAAAIQRGQIEEVRHRLRLLVTQRATYLDAHRVALSAGRNARVELARLMDELIDGYARMPEPPVWFSFGLGFPPEPAERLRWFERARTALTERRRVAATNQVY